MKSLILLILLFPSLAFAIDDATVQAIDSKASSANSKADGNNSRIQALETEDLILHNRINNIQLTPGPKGDKGDPGPQGIEGEVGPIGLPGLKGDKGDAGMPGIAGKDGINGTNGVDGTNGIDGVDGAQGPQGEKGDQGIQGTAGKDGLDGTNGVNGKSCTALQGPGSATISCEDGTMASVYDGSSVTGNTVGDMQYWDGVAWILISPPPSNANMLSFCNGTLTWTTEGCPIYYDIGDTGPAGGIVFHVTDGGLHGIEAAPGDQLPGEWGCMYTALPKADGTAVGLGAQNTGDILSGCAETGIAAYNTRTYISSTGITGWYLPSIDELNLLYASKDIVGGFSIGAYWSSTEIDSTTAWALQFYNGNQGPNGKYFETRVRAIRAF